MPGFLSNRRDPLQHSVLGWPAFGRVVVVAFVLATLWAAIAWAVAVP